VKKQQRGLLASGAVFTPLQLRHSAGIAPDFPALLLFTIASLS